MPIVAIDFVDSLTNKEDIAVQQGQQAYETSHGVVCKYQSFSVIARDDTGEPLGVLSAYTAYAEIYIEDLWVDANYRRTGIGTSLIEALEKRFKHRGYNNINLVTNQFQAVEFYQRCGFQIEFVRTNQSHPKLSKTFFIKYFDEYPQTQGLLTTQHSS